MLIGKDNNTSMYCSQYIRVFNLNNAKMYCEIMTTLRENLDKRMKLKGWNAYYLSEKSGVPQPTINRFLKGKIGDPRTSTIKKLAAALGISEAELRGFENNKNVYSPPNNEPSNAEHLGGFDTWDSDTPISSDEVAIPFFREVKLSAGNGSTEVQENHGCKLRFAKSTLKKKGVSIDHAYCVAVKGNSMEPVLPDGCTVGIDTSKTEVINGDWYAIDHLGELKVKLIYTQTGGGYRLRSFNREEYPDEPASEDSIKILGRVFWWSGLR